MGPNSAIPIVVPKKKRKRPIYDDDLLTNFHPSSLGITRKHNPNRNLLQERLQKRMAVDRLPSGFVKQRYFKLAVDAKSMRSYDEDGRLYVARTPIAKASVNPYMGAEIPDYEKLGLKPHKIYHLLRPPEELQKAVRSFNNIPLLNKHIRHGADDHDGGTVAGMIGSNAQFEYPYIYNSLAVWPQDAIDDVESESKRELSPSYHYDPDMTPGTWKGQQYDGVMRNIRANHVALVKDGRQGPDVVVADQALQPRKEKPSMKMHKGVPISTSAYARILASCAKPVLAQDARLDAGQIAPLFKGIDASNFTAKRNDLKKSLSRLLKNKLAEDQNSPDDVAMRLLDIIHGPGSAEAGGGAPPPGPDQGFTDTGMTGEGSDVGGVPEGPGMGAPLGGGPEARPEEELAPVPEGAPDQSLIDAIEEYLTDKGVDETIIDGLKNLISSAGANAEEPAPEPKSEGGEGESDSDSEDASPREEEIERTDGEDEECPAEDATEKLVEKAPSGSTGSTREAVDEGTASDQPPPFPGKPKVGGGMVPLGGRKMAGDSKQGFVTKPAMDAAIQAAVAKAREDERHNRNAIREAEKICRPYVGDLAIAYDSADKVYGAALKALKIEVKGVHPSAFRTILELQPKPERQKKPATVAMDEASTKSYAERFPGAERLKVI